MNYTLHSIGKQLSPQEANPQDLELEKVVWRKSPSNGVSALVLLARQKGYEIREDVMEYLTKK